MISIIKKAIIYLSVVSLVGYSIILIYFKLNPLGFFSSVDENKIMQFKIDKSNQSLYPYTNIIIGDSRPMVGLNPILLKHNFINFSIGAGTPLEGFLLLKNILKRNKIDTVIISFSINHFITDNIFKQSIYNHLITNYDLKRIGLLEKTKNITLEGEIPGYIISSERNLISNNNVLAFRSYFLSSLSANLTSKNHQFNTSKSNLGFQIFNDKDSSIEISKEFDLFNSKIPIKLNDILVSYLDSIHSICVEKDIKPIFIFFPLNQASKKHLYNTFYPEEMPIFKLWIQKRYPAFQIYDKYDFLPNNYFGDPHHLNKRGSDFFTIDFKNNFLEKELNIK
jgi:hypothetical protein